MTRTISRRAFMQLAAAGATGAVVPRFRRKQPPMSAIAAVDHLIVGVADLEAGIAWFEQRTGVRPAVGIRASARRPAPRNRSLSRQAAELPQGVDNFTAEARL